MKKETEKDNVSENISEFCINNCQFIKSGILFALKRYGGEV